MELLKFDTPDRCGEVPGRSEHVGCRLLEGTEVFIRANVDPDDLTESKIELRLEVRNDGEDEGISLTPDHHFPPAAIPEVGISLRDLLNPEDAGQDMLSMLNWAMEKTIAKISTLRIFPRGEIAVFKLSVGETLEYTWVHPLDQLQGRVQCD